MRLMPRTMDRRGGLREWTAERLGQDMPMSLGLYLAPEGALIPDDRSATASLCSGASPATKERLSRGAWE